MQLQERPTTERAPEAAAPCGHTGLHLRAHSDGMEAALPTDSHRLHCAPGGWAGRGAAGQYIFVKALTYSHVDSLAKLTPGLPCNQEAQVTR